MKPRSALEKRMAGPEPVDMSLASLRRCYAEGTTPHDVMDLVRQRIASGSGANAWIYLEDGSRLRSAVARIEQRRHAGEHLPLFGVPFGVKDNIDVAGMPTTAACPDFSFVPGQSARSVALLLDAGAICIGKTNLDQFATGLSGARSPYGTCASVGNADYVSGGSSSGSAVAVAAGHVSIALGTDTGGSGRIPAGFNAVVGIKPTVGRISARGLVPNCPSLDCVSIFATSVDDGTRVLDLLDGFDPDDPYGRRPPLPAIAADLPQQFSFGRLPRDQVECFGMTECAELYEQACDRLQRIGGTAVLIDFAPFLEAGRMLFNGPWIAERKASLDAFVSRHPQSVLDVIAKVLSAADGYSGTSVFTGMRRLAQLRRQTETLFDEVTTVMFPTAPRPFTIAAMHDRPVELNTQVGYYTHSANLLDLCGVSVPNAVLPNGVPMGVTFLGPAWHDGPIAAVASRFESTATGAALPRALATA
jgi:amidase/allophanate hydrolase